MGSRSIPVVPLLSGMLLAVLTLASMVVGMAGGTVALTWFIAAGACLAGAMVLAWVGVVSMARSLRALEGLKSLGPTDESARLDLASVARDGRELADSAVFGGLHDFILALNDDLAHLQRSATKFDLFASDILFSSRKLADQSESQVELMAGLRESARSFFRELGAISEQLGGLRAAITESRDAAISARMKVEESFSDLASMVDESVQATLLASQGSTGVQATHSAAGSLEAGLRVLEGTAEKGAADSGKIAEALSVLGDIVERTHILATNASIEAARAGANGEGFAVIAREIRSLSATSRQALEDTGRVLASIRQGILESARQVGTVSGAADKLKSALAETDASFGSIRSLVESVEGRIGSFERIMRLVSSTTGTSSDSAGAAASKIEGFERNYQARSAEYQNIVEQTSASDQMAKEARLSARILAQLASYLKAGGAERNRVLRRYRADAGVTGLRRGRKEQRSELLYNLEVFGRDGSFMGHLGDISESGLLLLGPRPLDQGVSLDLTVALPISSEGERRVDLGVTVRRVEQDHELWRIGCSLKDAVATRSGMMEISRSLSLDTVVDQARVEEQDAYEVAELEAL